MVWGFRPLLPAQSYFLPTGAPDEHAGVQAGGRSINK